MTQHDIFCKGLEAEGYKRDESTSKYTVFLRRKPNRRWFVGKAGALRYGRTVVESHPESTMQPGEAALISCVCDMALRERSAAEALELQAKQLAEAHKEAWRIAAGCVVAGAEDNNYQWGACDMQAEICARLARKWP